MHRSFIAWLMSLTVIMRYFVIALIVHVGLIALLGSIKIVAVVPKIVASFTGAPLPPPMDDTVPDDPFAAYRDFEYSGPELGAGGGLGGEGPGGVPTAGGVQYAAAIVGEMETAGVSEVIGVFSDAATAMARPSMGPSGLGGAPVSGIGDALAGTGGIKGPGGGILGARMGPARATNLKRFGGSQRTEQAVLAALRWLKDQQKPNGSWGNNVGIDGLALLAFLGHGENADSKEFGLTVSKAIEYIVDVAQKNNGKVPGKMYEQGIVGIALSEALSLTGSPVLREPAEKTIRVILDAQRFPKTDPLHRGGWRYSPTSDDADLSVGGWQIMAMKSARGAGIEIPEEAFEMAAEHVWNMQSSQGGFGYNKPGNSKAMTAVGILSQVFLNNGNDRRLEKSMDIVAGTKVSWGADGIGKHALYTYYYAALALIQGSGYHGERYWREWNRDFQKAVLDAQSEDGHWEFPVNAHSKYGLVYSTAMCTLMLEVYYRYLPMYQLIQTPQRGEADTDPRHAPTGAPTPSVI